MEKAGYNCFVRLAFKKQRDPVFLGTPTSRLHGQYYADSMDINLNTHLYKSEKRCDPTSGRHGGPSD